ncbi:MAG: DUF1289 domain-containing protein [Alteromonadaceae bacterium]|nr:MAG: DUF1289 domain-containing protein [Alteromonadaceae bacterium]
MSEPKTPRSPCIRNCCLDDDDICLGCFRHLEEIKDWSNASIAEQQQILERATHRKEMRKK